MLNQNDDHSSDNPANQEEIELTLEDVMGKLTHDEAEIIYSHIEDIKKAYIRKFEQLKYRQQEIDKLAQIKAECEIEEACGDDTKVKYSNAYTEHLKQTEELRQILLKLKPQ